jgi:asparagine synthase (glutamine-hydrolysing)
MRTTLAILNKNDENVVPTIIAQLQKNAPEATIGLAVPSEVTRGKKVKPPKINSPVAAGYASTAPAQSEPILLQVGDSSAILSGRIYTQKTAMENLQEALQQPDPKKAISDFLTAVEGDFSVIIVSEGQIVAVRDPVGVEPLYFGENQTVAALSLNRRGLWDLGIAEAKCFPPGNVGVVTKEGFRFAPVQTLPYQQPKPVTLEEAAQTLQKLLEDEVKRRVAGEERVAVAFSGGLDSSVVAFLAHRCGVEVELVHVSLENQPETEEAWEAAEELQLPMQVHLFKDSDIQQVIGQVVALIEEPDPIKAAIGVPFYWTAQKTAEAGFRVLLAGQGADELFGGYQRYVNQYLAEGDEKVRQTMYHDVANVHESNLERDEKICIFNDVELRLPFASLAVAAFAMSLPTELKFEKKPDTLRKLALRKAAENLGLSKRVVEKPKKAVQYSTGISNALKKLAKQQNLTLAQYVNQIYTKQGQP